MYATKGAKRGGPDLHHAVVAGAVDGGHAGGFSAFPVADRVYEIVQDFVFDNFVPTSSEVLQQYLSEFSAKASRLTGPGSAFWWWWRC